MNLIGWLVRNFSKSLANSYTDFYLHSAVSFHWSNTVSMVKTHLESSLGWTNTCLLFVAVEGSYTNFCLLQKSPRKGKLGEEGLRLPQQNVSRNHDFFFFTLLCVRLQFLFKFVLEWIIIINSIWDKIVSIFIV